MKEFKFSFEVVIDNVLHEVFRSQVLEKIGFYEVDYVLSGDDNIIQLFLENPPPFTPRRLRNHWRGRESIYFSGPGGGKDGTDVTEATPRRVEKEEDIFLRSEKVIFNFEILGSRWEEYIPHDIPPYDFSGERKKMFFWLIFNFKFLRSDKTPSSPREELSLVETVSAPLRSGETK